MVQLTELLAYTDNLLETDSFKDYCPNGLQVEGKPQIEKLVCGVTASQALIDAAIAAKADAILVHHGFFWRGEDARLIGIKKQRVQALLQADISLIAYHLPLDAHPIYGNNVQLAHQLGLSIEGQFGPTDNPAIGLHGRLPAAQAAGEFARHIARVLGRPPLHIGEDAGQIQTLAWCSGAAQGYIEQAAALGVDAYISGEVSEPTFHLAREHGMHYFAAGHHATERYGAMALGEHLGQHFGLQQQFIDIDNPV